MKDHTESSRSFIGAELDAPSRGAALVRRRTRLLLRSTDVAVVFLDKRRNTQPCDRKRSSSGQLFALRKCCIIDQ